MGTNDKKTESFHHFDSIAAEYDGWKKKNWYYYQNLKKLFSEFVPQNSTVLDIGCGTGDILVSLQASKGLGIDPSQVMIQIARSKHGATNMQFEDRDIFDLSDTSEYRYIIMADVLEHIENLGNFFKKLSQITQQNQKIIISLANPLWEPVLMLSEKLKMKMPEGPHWRLSIKENEKIFKHTGFRVLQKGYRLLIPKKIKGSERINQRFYKNKLLAKLGFVIFWVLQKV